MRSRRRSSLPTAPTTDVRPKTLSPNDIRPQPASPQVISSLIDSLAAISLPTHSHFENLPAVNGAVSSPASPNLQTHFGGDYLSANTPNGTDYAAYNQAVNENAYLYPDDDAAEFPVIRTSKPPSGLSPLTAPKKKDKDHSLKSYLSRNGGSTASIQSAHSGRSAASSFGNISVEPGIPRKVSNGSTRTSSESKRSAKGHRSLMYMSSRERLRSKDAERKRATIQVPELPNSSEPAWKPPPQLMVSEDVIAEEPVVAESSRAGQRYQGRGTSPLRNGMSLLNATDAESPSEKGLIPQRGSSLRHSDSPSRRGRKGHGRKGSRHDSYKTNTVPEEDENVEQELTTKDKILKELEAEDSEVAHRIRELRKQKLLRDKIAGKLPVRVAVGVDAGVPTSASHVSPMAPAEASPTSTVSSTSERRAQDPAKAHKVLGIGMPPTPPERRASSRVAPSPEQRETHETHRPHGHTRTRSLTVNDGDDITPLPINYKLALQTLERQTLERTTSSTPSSNASSKDTISSGTPPSRSKSFAVGGRSAVHRKTTNSMIMGAPPAHKHSASIPSGAASEKSFRSTSEDVTARHQSLQLPPPASSSLQHRPTLKKKRWSHPDLPAKAEQRHNDKVDALHAAAVQPAPHPVIEERPSSMDSIDMDIERFLSSSRLSQKIRHPQTGRVITFSEVGDPHGFAVFCCVGMGLTRFVMAFYDQLALTLRLRLITPDRPGIGGSQVDPNGTPLSWPDDVLVICQTLKITKFSLLAHSAGAVYALATSLRMPQHIRGRVHLLAPWIPPSQMAPIGVSQDQPPAQQLPRTQRFLRVLPPSLLKVANSTFLSATSASLQRSGPKNSPKAKRKTSSTPLPAQPERPTFKDTRRESLMKMDQMMPNASSLTLAATNPSDPNYERARSMKQALTLKEQHRQHEFDERLTFAIWDRATTNANPATDLIVCLETKQTIGFRYEDINRAVVIHHGSKDSRVPVDNVRWLGRLMRRCEVRILEGEQHGLMASAAVMGNVLTEMAADWEDWTAVTQGKTANGIRSSSRRRTPESLRLRH
ncbi:hypothetical protein BCR34DRAFT_625636 [Clohesyomyces aquaticus]|uniref:AB hydrolase-1 domain-containing protein n=1 Tax=Clohesyomyces aquaticus TaxID=1231657 RepID=A0A1Y1ZHM4_9PLEO|nr:hypothetical protein BCR34DRAFT_625636 [Clohesyomyces aquaticus]